MLRSVTESKGRMTAAFEGVVHDLLDQGKEFKTGDTVGSYRILEIIGHGGMGTVYRAQHQNQDIQHEVAIKLTRFNFSDSDSKVRFYTEQKILSRLSHRYITKLFDVGETDSGHPYLIMEYINGLPITEYCNQFKLSIFKRLTLFLDICESIQYAHQHGIIHRDLKPSNLLVSDSESRPVAKVIDFNH